MMDALMYVVQLTAVTGTIGILLVVIAMIITVVMDVWSNLSRKFKRKH